MSQELEIFEHSGSGYLPLARCGSWLVAIANWAERFDQNNFTKVERHLETDEVFVLLDGEATLIVGEKLERCPMEKGKIYNVKRGVWHHIFIKQNSKVLIAENSSTSKENSEYKNI